MHESDTAENLRVPGRISLYPLSRTW